MKEGEEERECVCVCVCVCVCEREGERVEKVRSTIEEEKRSMRNRRREEIKKEK
jgi:hypothetical protein